MHSRGGGPLNLLVDSTGVKFLGDGEWRVRKHDRAVALGEVIVESRGIIDIDTAAEFPVRLVESGPAGGAVFAADIAARQSLDKVLSFDMGGTIGKICLIKS